MSGKFGPLERWVDSDEASVHRQQIKEAFQPVVMVVRLSLIMPSLFLLFIFRSLSRDIQLILLPLDVWRRGQDQDHLTSQVGADRPHLKGRGPIERSRLV